MSLTDLTWLATACYALHIVEEYELNWRDWARAVIKLPVEWSDFFVVNALVIVFGIVAANLAADWPLIALTFPALMLIDATFFHILPMLRTGGRYSPGLFTAIALFWPVGVACYWRAAADGALGAGTLIGSLVLGALLMASPIVLLELKSRPSFRQDR
jgi:hypothetical protein